MSSYRTTQSAYVCQPTNYFEDLTALEGFISNYKKLGGKVPVVVEAAMQAAKAGENVEKSMNIACDGLFKFYMDAETKCAKEAGFSSLEELAAKGGERWQEREQIYDPCIASVARQWPVTNINYTINPSNPESALRKFLEESANQVGSIISKYIKKSVLKQTEP